MVLEFVLKSAVPLVWGVTANAINTAARRAAVFTGDRAAVVSCGSVDTTITAMVKLEAPDQSPKSVIAEANKLRMLNAASLGAKLWTGSALPDVVVRTTVLLQWADGQAFHQAIKTADSRARRP